MDENKLTPTAAELEILNILWGNEPLSVKEIHEELLKSKDVGYTTALKIMQNMTAKGLLKRELKGKSHLYYSCGKCLWRFSIQTGYATFRQQKNF